MHYLGVGAHEYALTFELVGFDVIFDETQPSEVGQCRVPSAECRGVDLILDEVWRARVFGFRRVRCQTTCSRQHGGCPMVSISIQLTTYCLPLSTHYALLAAK